MKYPVYLQFKIAPEIGSLGTKFFRSRALFFLEINPRSYLSPPLRPTAAPPRIQVCSRPGAATRAAAPPLRALCAAASCARGCAQPRVVARGRVLPPPGSGRGCKGREGEFEWERIRVQVDLKLGRKRYREEERKSFSLITNVGVGVF